MKQYAYDVQRHSAPQPAYFDSILTRPLTQLSKEQDIRKSRTPHTVDRVREECMVPSCSATATMRVIRMDGTTEYTCAACVPERAVRVQEIAMRAHTNVEEIAG